MNNKDVNNDFNAIGTLKFFYKWRKHLLIIGFSAAVISAIISLTITPMYKSVVVMFPTSTNSVSKVLLSATFKGQGDIMEFGEEEQAEQMLQILNSSEIRTKIAEKYNLMEHYNISQNSKYKYTKLYEKYNDNISFRRTEFMAVEINVMDKYPQIAADIANDIANLLDSTKNKIIHERASQALVLVEYEYLKLKAEMQEMEDSLTQLRKYGVHDYESQAEMINQQLAIEIAKGNQVSINALEKKLEILAEYGGPYVSIRDALEYEKEQLSLIKSKYEEARIDATQNLPQKFIVDKAYPAEKKSYPIRWLIVVVSTFVTFFLSIILIILLENLNKIRLSYNEKDK